MLHQQMTSKTPAIDPAIFSQDWRERETMRSELLEALPAQLIAELGATNFDIFSSVTMAESFTLPSAPFHRHLTETVSTEQMTKRRKVVVGPRGWGKSTTITEGGTLWLVCRNKYIPLNRRYKFILIVSDTAPQAEARLAVIKSNLETNSEIEKLYPEAFGVGAIWRAGMIVTKNDICIAAVGINSSIRGTRYKTRRPDLILVDDPDNLDTANSPTSSKEIEDKFNRDILKCGHKHTDVIVVGTIISRMCLTYKLLNSERYASWEGTIFKALKKFPSNMRLWNQWGDILKDRRNLKRKKMANVFYKNNQTEMDEGGISNWPEVYTVYELMEEYYTEGRSAFITEKQNELIESESSHFRPNKYRYMPPSQFDEIMLNDNPILSLYVDPTVGISAPSKKILNLRGPDKFVATVLAKIDTHFFVPADMTAKPTPQSGQFEEVAKMLYKWRIYHLYVESNAGQMHYVTALQRFLIEKYADTEWREGAKTDFVPSVRPVNNTAAKEDRISMLEPYLDNHTIWLREGMPGDLAQLEREMEVWPHAEFDDCLDSLAGAFFSMYRIFKFRNLHGGGQ